MAHYKPRPTAKQVRLVRAALVRETAAAQAALNGQGGDFAAHMGEVRVLQAWLNCYVPKGA